MTQRMREDEVELVAELNDLLQLDHDAVQAYTVALNTVRNEGYRETLAAYRGDHERHIRELTELIRAHGGIPIQLPHLPSGLFKLAVQGIGAAGGDRDVLLAFKANERQVRDKYQRAAARPRPEDVAATIRRGAEDEVRHYDWVVQTLDDLGYGEDSRTRRVADTVERGHARVADVMEQAEKDAMRAAEGARQGLKDVVQTAGRHPITSVAMAAGIGMIAASIFGRGRRG